MYYKRDTPVDLMKISLHIATIPMMMVGRQNVSVKLKSNYFRNRIQHENPQIFSTTRS